MAVGRTDRRAAQTTDHKPRRRAGADDGVFALTTVRVLKRAAAGFRRRPNVSGTGGERQTDRQLQSGCVGRSVGVAVAAAGK